MNRKKILESGIVLLTVGGVFIAAVQVRIDLMEVMPFLTPSFFKLCLWLGIVMFTLGLLLLLFLLLPIETAGAVWRWFFGKKVINPSRLAQRDDLPDIYAFGCEEFGDVSPLEKMREWHRLNKRLFYLVTSVRRGRFVRQERMIGYYTLIPLKAAAVPLLEDDNFDGRHITADFIVREKKGVLLERPACIYIGSVAARGSKFAQGRVMGELLSRIQHELNKGVGRIYSRPVTRRGLELLLDNNFEPVKPHDSDPLNHIYRLAVDAPPQQYDEEVVVEPVKRRHARAKIAPSEV